MPAIVAPPPVAMFHVKHRFVLARRGGHIHAASNRRSPHEHLSRRAAVPTARRIRAVAAAYGAVAGAVAGLALTLMNGA